MGRRTHACICVCCVYYERGNACRRCCGTPCLWVSGCLSDEWESACMISWIWCVHAVRQYARVEVLW